MKINSAESLKDYAGENSHCNNFAQAGCKCSKKCRWFKKYAKQRGRCGYRDTTYIEKEGAREKERERERERKGRKERKRKLRNE